MAEKSGEIHDYESFLDSALRRYWATRGSNRATFLALLLAAPEAWQVAWDESTKDGLLRPVLAGAASVAAFVAVLRILASGSLGVLFTGVSFATLVAVYGVDHDKIRGKAASIRALVDRYRTQFDELREERAARSLRDAKWELMMDALMGRFLAELDDVPEAMQDPASMGGFSEHVPGGGSLRPPVRR
jgi:hypothetical protein